MLLTPIKIYKKLKFIFKNQSIFMKIYKILIFIFLYQISSTLKATKITDSIVTLINDHIILDSDVKKNLNTTTSHNTNKINQTLSPTTSSYQEMIDQLIKKILISNAANQENISIENNEINKTINEILNVRHITLNQLKTYLTKIGSNYNEYYLKLHQDMINNIMCERIVHQRIHILPDEINEITPILNAIDYNKQFKIIHIIIPTPIYATHQQIQFAENNAKNIILNHKTEHDIIKIINTYNSKNHIFHTIKTQQTSWIYWQDIPTIFDQYLQTIQIGDLIGPIRSYDGIHILKIIDIRNKTFKFPITQVKMKAMILQTSKNKQDIIQDLINIKNCIDNGYTTFDITVKEKSQNSSYIVNYIEHLQWKNLNKFAPEIKNAIQKLKKNEISMPINTEHGWYLIQLIDINNINYSMMIRERAYNYLLHQKFNTIINTWIQELRSISYIKTIQ